MVSLDFRTRTDDDIAAVETRAFFEEQLPELIAKHAHLAVPGARELGVEPFSFVTPSGEWTLAVDGDTFTIERGDDGVAAVRLSDADVADVVNDLKTPMTFLTGGTLDMPRGNLGNFLDWWVVLRSLIDARPVHTAGAVDVPATATARRSTCTARSRPTTTTPTSRTSSREAGFLHLRGWFDADDDGRDLAPTWTARCPTYARDDGRSWWAKTADGDDRCVRMQSFQEHSATTCASCSRANGSCASAGSPTTTTVLAHRGNRIEALVKPIGVVEGISDVPWHKDCSLGHALVPLLRPHRRHLGDRRRRALGSAARRRGLAPRARAARVRAPRAPTSRSIDLPTATGDVTVHCSCTLHMSQPPVERERRVMYTGFGLARGRGRERSTGAWPPISVQVREGAYKTVSQAPGYTGAR